MNRTFRIEWLWWLLLSWLLAICVCSDSSYRTTRLNPNGVREPLTSGAVATKPTNDVEDDTPITNQSLDEWASSSNAALVQNALSENEPTQLPQMHTISLSTEKHYADRDAVTLDHRYIVAVGSKTSNGVTRITSRDKDGHQQISTLLPDIVTPPSAEVLKINIDSPLVQTERDNQIDIFAKSESKTTFRERIPRTVNNIKPTTNHGHTIDSGPMPSQPQPNNAALLFNLMTTPSRETNEKTTLSLGISGPSARQSGNNMEMDANSSHDTPQRISHISPQHIAHSDGNSSADERVRLTMTTASAVAANIDGTGITVAHPMDNAKPSSTNTIDNPIEEGQQSAEKRQSLLNNLPQMDHLSDNQLSQHRFYPTYASRDIGQNSVPDNTGQNKNEYSRGDRDANEPNGVMQLPARALSDGSIKHAGDKETTHNVVSPNNPPLKMPLMVTAANNVIILNNNKDIHEPLENDVSIGHGAAIIVRDSPKCTTSKSVAVSPENINDIESFAAASVMSVSLTPSSDLPLANVDRVNKHRDIDEADNNDDNTSAYTTPNMFEMLPTPLLSTWQLSVSPVTSDKFTSSAYTHSNEANISMKASGNGTTRGVHVGTASATAINIDKTNRLDMNAPFGHVTSNRTTASLSGKTNEDDDRDTTTQLPDTTWPVKHSAIVEGDVIIGGLMMVHSREDSITCGPIMPQGGIQALEVMLFTLDRINEAGLLPNISLGAHILDDCDKDTYGLEMAVDFIKGKFISINYSD